jgi:hypothetical protein
MPKELPAYTFTLIPPDGSTTHPRLQLNDKAKIPTIRAQRPKHHRVAGAYIDVFYPGTEQDEPPCFEKYCGWAKHNGEEYLVISQTAVKGWADKKVEHDVDRWHYSAEYEGWFSQLKLPQHFSESKTLAIGLWQNKEDYSTAGAFFAEHKPTPGAHDPDSNTEHHTVVVVVEGDGN